MVKKHKSTNLFALPHLNLPNLTNHAFPIFSFTDCSILLYDAFPLLHSLIFFSSMSYHFLIPFEARIIVTIFFFFIYSKDSLLFSEKWMMGAHSISVYIKVGRREMTQMVELNHKLARSNAHFDSKETFYTHYTLTQNSVMILENFRTKYI